MSDKIKVIIVDDEEANRRLLERSLSKDYEIMSFKSGEDCLSAIDSFEPDIFLLDILMPGGMDGYELCKTIKEHHKFKDTLIIFLSALSTLKEKTNGYKVGADDYITKPIELPILFAKISKLTARVQASKESHSEAMQMAMMALTNGSEIGQLNLFFEKLHEAASYSELGKLVIDVCSTLGINCAFQLRLKDGNMNFSTSGSVNTLEDELMVMTRDADRIYSFGKRCLFNFSGATLLVRIMPEDDGKAGRYRDHLASLMNGVEARLRSLRAELSLKSQNDNLIHQALKQTHLILDEIVHDFKRQDQRTSSLIEKLTAEMHMAFSYIDLDQEQEEYLMNIINNVTTELHQVSQDGTRLDIKFEDVIGSLEEVLNPKSISA